MYAERINNKIGSGQIFPDSFYTCHRRGPLFWSENIFDCAWYWTEIFQTRICLQNETKKLNFYCFCLKLLFARRIKNLIFDESLWNLTCVISQEIKGTNVIGAGERWRNLLYSLFTILRGVARVFEARRAYRTYILVLYLRGLICACIVDAVMEEERSRQWKLFNVVRRDEASEEHQRTSKSI